MKRHENLNSAILSFASAVVFAGVGVIISILLAPYIDGEEVAYLFIRMLPLAFYCIGAVFAVFGIMALVNERAVENGEVIEAKITGINEYFVGKGTEDVHYNLFAEYTVNGRKYRFTKKNMDYNPSKNLPNGLVQVKINPKDPRQYYVMLK